MLGTTAVGKDRIVDRLHPEWSEHRRRWRWLLDSLEGGQRYRDAVYGTDSRGFAVYNLLRHKREYPDPREAQESLGLSSSTDFAIGGSGVDPGLRSTDDDFELRRARTPIPSFVPESISTHLGVVYSKEIQRNGIKGAEFAKLREWMEDVDGRGTKYDDWIREAFAPLFLVLGQLDLYFDHPRRPDGIDVETMEDVRTFGLDRCVVSYILPENLKWWRIDPITGEYLEVLLWECVDPEDADGGDLCWHWTSENVRGLDKNGAEVVDSQDHPFGSIPIVRLFDTRKFRCRNIGQSRYENIAERQREFYNRDSELILSDVLQSHPILQGPEDFLIADGMINVGPSAVLPMHKSDNGTSTSYQGWEYVDPPKGAADSIRQNKADIRDDVDRDARLAKPAGTAGTGVGPVGQSGLSKVMDAQTGNRYLATIATSLSRCERKIIEYALRVLLHRPDVSDLMTKVDVVYPTDYDLQSSQDLLAFMADFMDLVEQSGNTPETEIIGLSRCFRAGVPGLDDTSYRKVDREIRKAVEDKAEARDRAGEMKPFSAGIVPANTDDDELEQADGTEDSED